jgi:regulator of protease activity HflC (stomatin/prohibitin superfamily)
VQENKVQVSAKTKDSVFVDVEVIVQYQVIRSKVYEAFYRLQDVPSQLRKYVFDAVRGCVAGMLLDECFEMKDTIADQVKGRLGDKFEGFGWSVLNVLITEVVPDTGVREAMNEIQKSRRQKEATKERMEATKTLIVKQAEGEAESKKLSGMGVARQRKAIIDGLKENISEFTAGDSAMVTKDVLELMLATQYFDTLRDMSTGTPNTKVTFLHTGYDEGGNGVRNAMMVANAS